MEQPLTQTPPAPTPWTVRVLTTVWALTQLRDFIDSRNNNDPGWPESRPDGLAFTMAEILQFIYGFLIIALIVYGLVNRSRFAWVVAFVWQGVLMGLGFVNFTINDYEFDAYLGFSGVPFYGVVLPIAVALLSFILLLLPMTQRWVRENR